MVKKTKGKVGRYKIHFWGIISFPKNVCFVHVFVDQELERQKKNLHRDFLSKVGIYLSRSLSGSGYRCKKLCFRPYCFTYLASPVDLLQVLPLLYQSCTYL